MISLYYLICLSVWTSLSFGSSLQICDYQLKLGVHTSATAFALRDYRPRTSPLSKQEAKLKVGLQICLRNHLSLSLTGQSKKILLQTLGFQPDFQPHKMVRTGCAWYQPSLLEIHRRNTYSSVNRPLIACKRKPSSSPSSTKSRTAGLGRTCQTIFCDTKKGNSRSRKVENLLKRGFVWRWTSLFTFG